MFHSLEWLPIQTLTIWALTNLETTFLLPPLQLQSTGAFMLTIHQYKLKRPGTASFDISPETHCAQNPNSLLLVSHWRAFVRKYLWYERVSSVWGKVEIFNDFGGFLYRYFLFCKRGRRARDISKNYNSVIFEGCPKTGTEHLTSKKSGSTFNNTCFKLSGSPYPLSIRDNTSLPHWKVVELQSVKPHKALWDCADASQRRLNK